MAIRVLGIDIMSYLKGNGFEQADKQVGVLKGSLNGLKGIANSSLGQLALGYVGVSQMVSQYGKAIEMSNYQKEQETKLYSTLKGQGFQDEQIERIKKYTKELEKQGVVSEENTLAGVQQLATYNLTEDGLKKLTPALKEIIVQQKGLTTSGGDAVGAANMLAKGLLGQTGELKQAGITLNQRQEQLIKVGTQEQKVAALVEAVTMNVGEQNKAFLNTPEGKIKSVQLGIGGIYKDIGAMFRDSRLGTYEFIGNNLDVIKRFLTNMVQASQGTVKAIVSVGSGIKSVFSSMPSEVKTTIKLISGFFAISQFPIVGGILLIEDLFVAFEGGESLIKNTYDELMEFLEIDITFDESITEIKELWETFEKGNGVKITFEALRGSIDTLVTALGLLGDTAKITLGILGTAGNTAQNMWKLVTDDDYTFEDVKKDMADSWDNGSGKLLRSGFNGGIDRLSNYGDNIEKRWGNITGLYGEGQKRIQENEIPVLAKKKEISDIKIPTLSMELPREKNNKIEINYKPADIKVTINQKSETNGDTSEFVKILEKYQKEEEAKLKAMIGGEMIR